METGRQIVFISLLMVSAVISLSLFLSMLSILVQLCCERCLLYIDGFDVIFQSVGMGIMFQSPPLFCALLISCLLGTAYSIEVCMIPIPIFL